MGTQPVVKGAIADAVAGNVQAVRVRRGLSQQALATRLGELGRPLQASAIAKIEGGDRRVDVDDLVALAAALNVTPARLLLPDGDADQLVKVTPAVAVPTQTAWQWATGVSSLLPEDHDLNDPKVQRQELDFVAERPFWLLTVEQHPLDRAAKHLQWAVRRALQSRAGVAQGKGQRAATGIGLPSWLASVRRAVADVENQIEQLAEGVT